MCDNVTIGAIHAVSHSAGSRGTDGELSLQEVKHNLLRYRGGSRTDPNSYEI